MVRSRGATAQRTRRNVDFWRRAFAGKPSDWYWETAPDNRIVWMSARGLELLDLSAAEVIGRRWDEIVDPVLNAEAAEKVLTLATRRAAFDRIVFMLREKSGATRYLEVSGVAFFAEEGAYGGYRGVGRDVTGRFRQREQSVAQQLFMQSVIDHLPHAISVFDAQGRLSLLDRQSRGMLGLPATLSRPNTPMRDLVGWILARAVPLAGTEPPDLDSAPPSYHGEFSYPGELVIDVRLLRMPKGEYILSCTDVTERHRIQADAARLERELRQSQKMEALGQLASGVAHEFNNLLVPVLALSDLSLPLAEGNERLTTNLKAIRTAGQRARSLIAKILSFTRAKEIHAAPEAMDDLVREVVDLMGSTMPRTITLTAELARLPDRIEIDRDQIEQALINLIANARDAIGLGAGSIIVRLEDKTLGRGQTITGERYGAGRYVCLSVSDTGAGIPATILGKVFDPFFTTKPVGAGTGLGLAVVQGAVKANGGLIDLKSSPGEGTTVYMYWRLKAKKHNHGVGKGPGDGESSVN